MENNKDKVWVKMLISLIELHKKVKYWSVDNDEGILTIDLEEELGVYDIEIFNHFLSDIKEENVFETNAKFKRKEDYKTIYTKLKNKN